MRLQDKVAIVTGTATGIGQATAIPFAREGAAVVVDYIGKPDVAGKTEGQIAGFRGKSIAIAADTSKPDQVQNLIDGAVKAFGKLDIIVNNVFLVSQAAARQMIRQGHGGRLINVSSVHEDLPMPTNAAYCVSKGGLRMLTRTIAVELGKDKIM